MHPIRQWLKHCVADCLLVWAVLDSGVMISAVLSSVQHRISTNGGVHLDSCLLTTADFTGGTTYRVPWLFDEESCDVLRFFVKLKCRLMPYLYAQAMEAHTDGTPLLRAMILEFPEDKNCRSLDLEYMLGESLFVAPIFREDSKVEYYLPHGKWVHLLDGRCVDGGSWRSEEYDYMSLPLFIRENHILLLGNRDDVPDYDYENGFTVCIPEFEDGASAKAVIPSEDGEAGLATAVRNGNQIMVEISMEKTSGGENTVEWNLKKIGNEAVRIEKDGNKAVIYL